MRNKTLSFLIAAGVMIFVVSSFYMIKHKIGGEALASVYTENFGAKRTARVAVLKKISHNPDAVLNLTGQDIQAALKAPGLIRRDLPTIIWQYRSDSCVLDIYFKATSDNVEQMKASHYEMRQRQGHAENFEKIECANSIARTQSGMRMVDIKAIYKAL